MFCKVGYARMAYFASAKLAVLWDLIESFQHPNRRMQPSGVPSKGCRSMKIPAFLCALNILSALCCCCAANDSILSWLQHNQYKVGVCALCTDKI